MALTSLSIEKEILDIWSCIFIQEKFKKNHQQSIFLFQQNKMIMVAASPNAVIPAVLDVVLQGTKNIILLVLLLLLPLLLFSLLLNTTSMWIILFCWERKIHVPADCWWFFLTFSWIKIHDNMSNISFSIGNSCMRMISKRVIYKS